MKILNRESDKENGVISNGNFVFVYGTLLKGFHNHARLLDREPRYEYCSIVGNMISLGGFPGAIDIDLASRLIQGEVYEVTDQELSSLDALEGYMGEGNKSNLYNRILTDVFVEDKEKGEIWNLENVYVYEYNNRYGLIRDIIDHGSWRLYTQKR